MRDVMEILYFFQNKKDWNESPTTLFSVVMPQNKIKLQKTALILVMFLVKFECP
jgi:hypothetical protein